MPPFVAFVPHLSAFAAGFGTVHRSDAVAAASQDLIPPPLMIRLSYIIAYTARFVKLFTGIGFVFPQAARPGRIR